MSAALHEDDAALWQRLAHEAGAVLASPAWQRHLAAALNAECHFLPDADRQDGLVLQVFKRGPFKAGYIGFPLGGTVRGQAVGAERIKRLLTTPLARKLHVLRVTGSAFNTPEDAVGEPQTVPETCIVDLPACDPEQISKVRHDLARARRAGVDVRESADDEICEHIYRTYAATVARHGGVVKYEGEYFAGLGRLAQTDARLRILTAHIGTDYAGYVVLALHGSCAYYMHAGVRPEFQKTGAGDLLLARALEIAKQAGMQSFNMMASPAAQPGLIKFKEKWGAVTQPQVVQTLAVSGLMAALMKIAEKLYRIYSGMRR